ncbi:type II secretion system minor pseudopilin GspJ [Parendozoicomonas sp. Alg238-R29]|uniref:type II secretion system minor pseudopilin GspJ n=1 Tax=Parendozoicomonas sp. Alg238-R29 TaxID=2993446 RepID=UPI00248EEBAA|nr:type II secretion system minor pseudopilin GspJ [Parendozoicomonas sp. Alg238-R29]
MITLRQLRNAGFTLLELLIAIAIFGLLAAGCYRLFKSVSSTHEVASAIWRQNSELQRSLAIIQKDFSQLAIRPIRNEFGDREPALTTALQKTLVTFTHHGWRNHTGAKRSELQRVSYVFDSGRLLRRYWETLDRAPDTPYREQVLMDNIQGFTLRFRDEKKRWHESWPPVSDKQSERLKVLPSAVEYTILHEKVGSVKQLVAAVTYKEEEKKATPSTDDNKQSPQNQRPSNSNNRPGESLGGGVPIYPGDE